MYLPVLDYPILFNYLQIDRLTVIGLNYIPIVHCSPLYTEPLAVVHHQRALLTSSSSIQTSSSSLLTDSRELFELIKVLLMFCSCLLKLILKASRSLQTSNT